MASAEVQFEKGEWDEDLLLMAATHYMEKRKEKAKVIAYSLKLLELMEAKAKPEEISDAEWDSKKRHMIGTANWMAGLLFSTQESSRPRTCTCEPPCPISATQTCLPGPITTSDT